MDARLRQERDLWTPQWERSILDGQMVTPDAIVVGSGPNGLAAAITLAQAGLSVQVLEAEETIGGGTRSAELTLPCFTHDVCSAIHPLAYASPFFRTLPLEKFGLSWVHSPAEVAHPFADGSALLVERSLASTAAKLGEDETAYRELLEPAVRAWTGFLGEGANLGFLLSALQATPLAGHGLRSVKGLAGNRFRKQATRALLAGMAGHSTLPLHKSATAGIAIGLATLAHSDGWPFPRGGAQKIADALAGYLRSLGGRIETGHRVQDLRELPTTRAILLDVTPRQLLALARPLLPGPFARVLEKYRYGTGVFKLDWALAEPVPWRSPEVKQAATVHMGASLEEIAASEAATWQGRVSDRPFVIAAQHSLFDPTRAPAGRHTLWAYAHVPHGSGIDLTGRIEAQIERMAPGFRDCVLGRSAMGPRQMEARNANLIGGDISGGVPDLWQMLVRPSLRYWATPLPNLYLCSSSTPPGVGVHGMCGHLAARLALRRNFGIRSAPVTATSAV